MHPEMRWREVVIRYVGVDRPNIASSRPSKEIAEKYFYDWWEYRFGPEPEIIDITVDGEVFKSLEDTR